MQDQPEEQTMDFLRVSMREWLGLDKTLFPYSFYNFFVCLIEKRNIPVDLQINRNVLTMQILVGYSELSMLFFSWTFNYLKVAHKVCLHILLHLWNFSTNSTDNIEKKGVPEWTSPVFLEQEKKMHCLICFFTPSLISNFKTFNIISTYMTCL